MELGVWLHRSSWLTPRVRTLGSASDGLAELSAGCEYNEDSRLQFTPSPALGRSSRGHTHRLSLLATGHFSLVMVTNR